MPRRPTDDVHDYVLDLLVSHDAVSLTYDECAGVSYDDVHADPEGAMDRIVARYHQVAEKSDAVVIVGSDYTDVGAPAEFAFNARVAANLGAPVLLVLNGNGRGVDQLCTAAAMAEAELAANHAKLFAVIANRVDPAATERTAAALRRDGVPAFALPEQPLLSAPSVGDLMAACDGRLVRGDESQLAREVPGLVVAAMTLPNVLDRLFDGALVVTPADRPEVVLGVLTAHQSANFPQISGVVLNGGLELPEQVGRLLDGLEVALPMIATDLGTHATSTALTNRRGRLDKDSPRKIATALTLFAENVDGEELMSGLEVARTSVVTPLMFEHQVLDDAIADRRHIVLPEGEEERILRAADILLRRNVADLTLLGDPMIVRAKAAHLGIDVSAARLLSPYDEELRERFAQEYHQRRSHKGIDLEAARDIVVDVSYFGTMMVELGLADGMVSGAVHTTAHTIRPALEVIRTVPRGVGGVVGVLHVPARPGARLRRLRGQPRPDRHPAGRHRDRLGPHRCCLRRRAAGRHAVVLDRHLRQRHRRREGHRGDGARPRACAGPAGRGADPVRRRHRRRGRADQAARLGRGRASHGLHLPRPQHGQQHLQGRAALGRRAGSRPGAAGPPQAGQRPLARRVGA